MPRKSLWQPQRACCYCCSCWSCCCGSRSLADGGTLGLRPSSPPMRGGAGPARCLAGLHLLWGWRAHSISSQRAGDPLARKTSEPPFWALGVQCSRELIGSEGVPLLRVRPQDTTCFLVTDHGARQQKVRCKVHQRPLKSLLVFAHGITSHTRSSSPLPF